MEYDCHIFLKYLAFQMKKLLFRSKTLDVDKNTWYLKLKNLRYWIFERNTWFFGNLEFQPKSWCRDDNHVRWLLSFFPYVWPVTKTQNVVFKIKLITKFNSNYDIITTNCNIIIILITLQMPSVILSIHSIKSSTDSWFFLTFD